MDLRRSNLAKSKEFIVLAFVAIPALVLMMSLPVACTSVEADDENLPPITARAMPRLTVPPMPPLPPPEPDRCVVPTDVAFDFDSYDLRSGAADGLTACASHVAKHVAKGGTVLALGSADGVGEAQYNLSLSRARAETVVSLMVTKFGINSQRIRADGIGEQNAVDGKSDPDQRRVDVILQ